MVILIFIAFIFCCLTADGIIQLIRKKNAIVPATASSFSGVFDQRKVKVPAGLYFDKTHTWVHMEKNGNVRIGINDFLQHITGPITSIWMKNPGVKIKKGQQIVTIIQEGKHLNIYAPISGIVKTQNRQLLDNSSMINSSPYSDGWVYTIEPENWLKEVQFMKMADMANEWLRNEFSRVKDFLAGYYQIDNQEYAHAVLQDGGGLMDNILANMGPEVWDDFQTNFIDTVN